MTEQESVQVVEQIYAAFERGNIQAIHHLLADDVDWEFPGPEDIPFGGGRRGREIVAQFFTSADETVEVEKFEPQAFVAQGDRVIVLGYERVRVKSTGHFYETDWVHVWTVREGKVVRLREYSDTAAIVKAFRGG